jgi:hypothetical protein
MTARRRRKPGSGPSASALIAWVGGSQAGIATHVGAPVSAISDVSAGEDASAGGAAGGRAILLGRACGLTAGTLLAFGSVLVGATNVGEGPLAGAPVLNSLPAVPDAAADTPIESHADAPAESTSAAPDQVSTQAVTETSKPLHPPLGQVHRNSPASVGVPATEPNAHSDAVQQPSSPPPPAKSRAPQGPAAPITPVLDPAAQGVGRVAPVGGVLAPKSPSQERVNSETGPPRDAPAANTRDQHAILPVPTAVAGGVRTIRQVATPLSKVTGVATDRTTDAITQPVTQSVVQPAARGVIRPVVQPVAAPVARPVMAALSSLLPTR